MRIHTKKWNIEAPWGQLSGAITRGCASSQTILTAVYCPRGVLPTSHRLSGLDAREMARTALQTPFDVWGTADAQAAHHRLARGYLLSGVALAWLDRGAESVASSVVHGRLVAVDRGVEAAP